MPNPKKNSVMAEQEKILTEAIRHPASLRKAVSKTANKKSIDWFVRKVRYARQKEKGTLPPRKGSKRAQLGPPGIGDQALDPGYLFQVHSFNNIITPGNLYIFRYEAKHKDTLPYWDRYPLVIPISMYSDGFLGMNFHYLPVEWRVKLLQAMIKTFTASASNVQYIKTSYEQMQGLKRMRAFRPTIHRYLSSHIKTKPQRIPPTEWVTSIALPLQKFVGKSATYVWAQSLERF